MTASITHLDVSEGAVGRALAIGELNLTGALIQMYRHNGGDIVSITQQMQGAYEQLNPHGKQVVRQFASQLTRIVQNG